MKVIAKFIASIGVLGVVAGGIMCGVGAAQGGNIYDVVKQNSIEVISFEISENEEMKAKGLDINLDVGNINLLDSSDDKLKVEYQTENKMAQISSFNKDKIEIKYELLSKQISLVDTMNEFFIKDYSVLNVYIPSWYTLPLNIDLACGKVDSKVNQFNNNLNIEVKSGTLELSNIKKISDANLEVLAGTLKCDFTKLDKDLLNTPSLDLHVAVGTIDVDMSNQVGFTIKKCDVTVGSQSVKGDVADGDILISAIVQTGSISISNKY